MVRRSPCELYLKYLIVRHERFTDEQIKDICRLQQLDVLGSFYLQALRKETVPPVPFYPENTRHKPSFRFLLSQGLLSLFQPDVHMQTATKLLGHPRSKEIIESLLISQSPVSWITAALTRDGHEATAASIQQYKFHYFNVDLVDATELRAILRLRMQEGSSSTDPEVARVSAAYEKSAWKDQRIAAVNAPITPLASLTNAMRLGFLPDPAGLPRLLATSRMLGVVRMTEAMMANSQDSAVQASYYASVVKVAHDVLESTGDPAEDFHTRLASLTVKTDEAEVPLLETISGGAHTSEMEPIEGERHAGSGQPGT